MDPSSFETMREEQLQERESADVTNAAHILGKTLGVPVDGVPSFMQRPDIPGLPKQQEGIPPDHDCTICAATAACGFFSEAQKNGGNNPLMRRLQAVQELTKSSPDLMKGPDAENLIRERMEVLKIQAEAVDTAPSEAPPTKPEVVKPAAAVKQEPAQIVKEVAINTSSTPKETLPATPEVTSTPQPVKSDLKTTVTQFEEKVQPTPVIEKQRAETATSSADVSAKSDTATPAQSPTPSLSEKAATSTGSFDMKGKPATQVEPQKKTTDEALPEPKVPIRKEASQAQPIKPQEAIKFEPRPTAKQEAPVLPGRQEPVKQSEDREMKPEEPIQITRIYVEPLQEKKVIHNEEEPISSSVEVTDSLLTDEDKPTAAPPKPDAAIHTATLQSEASRPAIPETDEMPKQAEISKTPTHQTNEQMNRYQHTIEPSDLTPQYPAQEMSPADRPAPTQAEPADPAVTISQETSHDVMESGFLIPQPAYAPKPTDQATGMPEMRQQESQAEAPFITTRATNIPIATEFVNNIPDIVAAVPLSTDTEQSDTGTGESTAPESTHTEFVIDVPAQTPESIIHSVIENNAAPDTHTEEIPIEDAEKRVSGFPVPETDQTQAEVTSILTSEESIDPDRQETVQADTGENNIMIDTEVDDSHQSETVFVEDHTPSAEDPLHENTLPRIMEFSSEIHSEEDVVIETIPSPVLHSEETITLFSYEEMSPNNEAADLAHEEDQNEEVLPIFDLPLVPLDSIDTTQLMQFDAAGFVDETSNMQDQLTEVTAEEITFPEPFTLILETEQEVIDQIFKGVEGQGYDEKPNGVFVLPVAETPVVPDNAAEEHEVQQSQEVIVFVWTEPLFVNLSLLTEEINDVLASIEIEEDDLVGIFDYLFDSDPEVSDEELKNDTFGKYDDTVILLWYLLKIIALFEQAMLYIEPRQLRPADLNSEPVTPRYLASRGRLSIPSG